MQFLKMLVPEEIIEHCALTEPLKFIRIDVSWSWLADVSSVMFQHVSEDDGRADLGLF